ncbi:unnamed protein product [Thlaspi arvense]|uniref:F-box domain-containing protein n=1 Tax=Thlaspi arvense TaxID=13288 RepID=A0AAU9RPM4_THLAR|nr:unnamed protein product [Thlaspi arvense]
MEETKKTTSPKVNFLTDDLWENILVRLPLKNITTLKLVCKRLKTIVESPFLRELFLSRHQNSHSSWSLMCRDSKKEVLALYGCEIWGLQRSLGSYISSFLTDRFKKQRDQNRPCESFELAGLVTRIENNVVLGYKAVLMHDTSGIVTRALSLLIYSSETKLWSFMTLRTHLPLTNGVEHEPPLSLNGNLYWLGSDVVVSHDFYATGAESDRCSVIPFPDSGKETNFRRAFTASQGFLMYMSIVKEESDDDDGSWEPMLCVRRLETGEWQQVSTISPACIRTGFEYFPMEINPFDANTMYFWSKKHKCLASTHVHKGKFGLHNNLERSSDGRTLSFDGEWDPEELEPYFSTFVFPRWLYQIPSLPS